NAVHEPRYPATNVAERALGCARAEARPRTTSRYTATAGHTDGNIIAAIISTHSTTKKPSEPTENRPRMSIPFITPALADHAPTARKPSTKAVATRRFDPCEMFETLMLIGMRATASTKGTVERRGTCCQS